MKTSFPLLLSAALFLCTTSVAVLADDSMNDSWTNHGVISYAVAPRGIFATQNQKGQPVIVAKYAEGMLIIDAKTGETEFFPKPEEARGWAATFSLFLDEETGILYSVDGGDLVRFDYYNGEYEVIPTGTSGRSSSWIRSDDGIFYTHLNPGGELLSFDPETKEVRNHGPMVETDWAQLSRGMAVDDAGWVYCAIGRVDLYIAGFHPGTGERMLLGTEDLPDDTEIAGGISPVVEQQADDGRVYGRFPVRDELEPGIWFQFHNGQAEPVEGRPDVAFANYKTDRWGRVFEDFSDGRHRIHEMDFFDRRVLIEDADLAPRDTVREIEFEYTSEGAPGYSLVLGPDGLVYGSTGKPVRFFRFNPETDQLDEWSLWGLGGHTNVLAVQQGKIFGGVYSSGIFYQYDPKRSWSAVNPERLLTAGGELINRPHAMMAHPDGKSLVMTGSLATGMTGGGMLIYDMESGYSLELSDEKVIPTRATFALLALPEGDLIGGTTTTPAAGGARIDGDAELYRLDWDSKEVVWRTVPVEGADTIRDLWLGPDQRLFGIATMDGRTGEPIFFVYDLQTEETLHREDFSGYGPVFSGQGQPILHSWDDRLYVHLQENLIEIDPDTLEHRKVTVFPRRAWPGVITDDGTYYCLIGSELWSFPIPRSE